MLSRVCCLWPNSSIDLPEGVTAVQSAITGRDQTANMTAEDVILLIRGIYWAVHLFACLAKTACRDIHLLFQC